MDRQLERLAAVTLLGGVCVALAITPTVSAATTTQRDPSMDKRTRGYVSIASDCVRSAGGVANRFNRGASELDLYTTTMLSLDICSAGRYTLARKDTNHFRGPARQLWYGVDLYVSGLNALLKYFDLHQPSKFDEARNKFRQAEANASAGFRGINQRRKVYGLKPIKLR